MYIYITPYKMPISMYPSISFSLSLSSIKPQTISPYKMLISISLFLSLSLSLSLSLLSSIQNHCCDVANQDVYTCMYVISRCVYMYVCYMHTVSDTILEKKQTESAKHVSEYRQSFGASV